MTGSELDLNPPLLVLPPAMCDAAASVIVVAASFADTRDWPPLREAFTIGLSMQLTQP